MLYRFLLLIGCLFGCSAQPIFGLLGAPDGSLTAVGWLGNIWESRDGGASWEYQENPTEESITAIARGNDGTFYAAAEKGVLLQKKQGKTWEYAPTPNMKTYLSGVFADARGVFVVGEAGVLLSSLEQGETWRTTNIGKLWLRDVTGDSRGLYAVGFVGALYCSFDEGKTWQEGKSGTLDALYGAWGDGEGNVYVVGMHGAIFKISEQCKTSQRLSSGVDVTLFDIVGKEKDLLVVGSRGVVLRSIDQGKTWEQEEAQTEQELYSIAKSGDHWYAAGANRTTIEIARE